MVLMKAQLFYNFLNPYSLYDAQVGYCQGQSFLVAALLTVQMPEEEAFALFTVIMHDYSFRSLYLHSFIELRMRFWILERLIESTLPSLFAHFKDLGVEAHMFSSQWFLTLFTAKFPLSLVYHVIDWFLLAGPNVIYRLSLAMLRTWRRDLLALDFEGEIIFRPAAEIGERRTRGLCPGTHLKSIVDSRKFRKMINR